MQLGRSSSNKAYACIHKGSNENNGKHISRHGWLDLFILYISIGWMSTLMKSWMSICLTRALTQLALVKTILPTADLGPPNVDGSTLRGGFCSSNQPIPFIPIGYEFYRGVGASRRQRMLDTSLLKAAISRMQRGRSRVEVESSPEFL